MNNPDAIVREFLIESYENLDQLDQDLVQMEQNPTEKGLLASVFRTIHTIKGTCGFLGYAKLESIVHVGESLLTKLRDGELAYDQNFASVMLETVDAVRQILSCIENERGEGGVDYSSLVEKLARLQQGGLEDDQAVVKDDEDKSLFERIGGRVAVNEASEVFYRRILEDDRVNHYFEGAPIDDLGNQQKAFVTFALGGTDPADTHDALQFLVKKDLDDRHFDVVVENLGLALEELGIPINLIDEVRGLALSVREEVTLISSAIEQANQKELEQPAYNGPERRKRDEEEDKAFLANNYDRRASDSSIRVDVDILDKLMNLVGELVLARNQILQVANREQDATLTVTSQRLNLITTELQENVMQMRMQPIGYIWNKFPRMVRDLSLAMKKNVRLEMEGQDTELDKALIEAIKDPLTHIVRNSVDHGIEMPWERKACGKPEEGQLKLRAYHEGDQVIIDIADDGIGIDPEKIKRKAVEKRLITQDQASRMGDREAVNLIFHAGLSTAAKVTNVSGRGVGMDVVKTNIEKIGGTVDIQSKLREGTRLKVKIPLTLAIAQEPAGAGESGHGIGIQGGDDAGNACVPPSRQSSAPGVPEQGA